MPKFPTRTRRRRFGTGDGDSGRARATQTTPKPRADARGWSQSHCVGGRLQTRTRTRELLETWSCRRRLSLACVLQKKRECLWDAHELREAVRQHLIAKYDYYGFCHECIGSSDDLFAQA